MIELKRIYPECYSDTLLVELILQRGHAGHRKGISKVAKDLVEFERKDLFVVGLADTDKFKRDNENPNLHHFSEVVENRIQDEGLLILKIPNTETHLIRIHPEFEPWIWQRALESGINPADYGFNSVDELEKAAKRNEVAEDYSMKRLILNVIQKNSGAIKTLRRWLVKVLPDADQEIILNADLNGHD